MKLTIRAIVLIISAWAALAFAQGNLEIDTPAISALKSSMQQRHTRLAPFYDSGAIGLTDQGLVAIRDAAAAPISQRGELNRLVAEENADRRALYREIAQANGHPEWAADVQNTFAQRWIDKMPSKWWVQRGGRWAQQ